MKKASLSFQMIVVAILAVLVLAIVSFIFIKSINSGSTDLQSCAIKNGECLAEGQSCNGLKSSATCPDNQFCCISSDTLFGTDDEET